MFSLAVVFLAPALVALMGDLAMGKLVLPLNKVVILVARASGWPGMHSIVTVVFLDQKFC